MLLPILLFPLLALSSFASAPIRNKVSVEDVTLHDGGDGFRLSSHQKDIDESFVYTSVATFEEGQACGLAFGAEEGTHYWVFNIDRYENQTKLMYFSFDQEGKHVDVLRSECVVGNDKTTQSEFNMINPSLREHADFHLKTVITIEQGHAYAEFYIDNIKRFGVDSTIDLNALRDGLSYQGGNLGYNVFNGRTRFHDATLGRSDYSYYTEDYRNKYHYSQFAHWNNDPNGLVYYQGWYHLYYQTNPFSKQWGPMYWGHARSRDLLHWQELPIALFPDDGNMGVGLGDGFAWSGIAMVYHPGMSDAIDDLNWFPNGSGTGLLGYYTRDGARQDQVIITSDDEGMTWTKRQHIPQAVATGEVGKVDCRDPSIMPIKKEGDRVTLWGMILAGGTQEKVWFLKSENLLDWSYAGEFAYEGFPECASASRLRDDYYCLSISSRTYAVGRFLYDEGSGHIEFELPDGRRLSEVGKSAFIPMEYGLDSYAGQPIYIDDDASAYYGESVFISWMGSFAEDAPITTCEAVRDPWNSGGITIPVVLGLDESLHLTQTPITLENPLLEKHSLLSIENEEFDNETNPLESISTHTFELNCRIDNPLESSVEFKIAIGEEEYTSFGWSKSEGYFVDRTHTGDARQNIGGRYRNRFTTGETEGTELSFYVLSDDGCLDVFCGDFRYAFYNLTLFSKYSRGASLSSSGPLSIESLSVSEVSSIWKTSPFEGTLTLNKDRVDLNRTFLPSQEVAAYCTNGNDVSWEIEEGEDIVAIEETPHGARIIALKEGDALIRAYTSEESVYLPVSVSGGPNDCFFNFENATAHSGQWQKTAQGLKGSNGSGDGFLISDISGEDFTIIANLDLSNADAAGILLRASEDLSSYIMANIDKAAGITKIWSNRGEIARGEIEVANFENVTFTAVLQGNRLKTSMNGSEIIDVALSENEPKSGRVGLNVFKGEVLFRSVSHLLGSYEFRNEDLSIQAGLNQPIEAIYNLSANEQELTPSAYEQRERMLSFASSYLLELDEEETTTFLITTESSSFLIEVTPIKTWAKELLLHFTCSGVTQEYPNGAIIAADPTSIWENAKDLYNGISEEEKTSLKTRASNIDGDLEEQALARYDLVVAKYRSYEDFIGRFSQGGIHSSANLDARLDNNAQTLLIILMIAIPSLSIAAFFVGRAIKREE